MMGASPCLHRRESLENGMAKLTFYGATQGVTGSLYLIETAGATILLECGLVQGDREEEKVNKQPLNGWHADVPAYSTAITI